MKVIELLNKIAKGEEVKYKYLNNTYREYSIQQFLENYFDANFNQIEDDYAWLNDEIEIIDSEEWKTIEDFPNYEISTKGNVRTKEYFDGRNHIRQSKLLNKQVNNVGYEYVILSNEIVKHKTLTVHRLMAKTFLNDYFDTLDVNHINGIKTDNRIENLEMVTHSENTKKRYEIGIDGNNYKAVEQYDLDGNYIATYKSSYEAEKITNICRTSIGSCCRKEEGHYTAGGYIWKFKEEKEIKEMIINEQYLFSNMKECTYLSPEERRLLDSNFKELSNKINELVREVNKLKNK